MPLDGIRFSNNMPTGNVKSPGSLQQMVQPDKAFCLLLDVPLEIRQQIYTEVFAGSRISFDPLNLSHRPDIIENIREDRSTVFRASSHCNILSTNRQIYQEARPIYWAETVVKANFSSLSLLSDSLTAFAKAHVQHLRDINWVIRSGEESVWMLTQFLAIKTVSGSWLPTPEKWLYNEYKTVTKSNEFIVAYINKELNCCDRIPHDVGNRGVQFLMDLKLSESNWHCKPNQLNKHTYYNLSTGKLFVEDSTYEQSWNKDTEPGFQKVIS